MNLKLPTIKFSSILLWQIFVVAFLFLFVVTSVISTYMFMRIKDEMIATSVNVDFTVQTIDIKQLNEVVLNLEKRQELFRKNLLGNSSAEDPSV